MTAMTWYGQMWSYPGQDASGSTWKPARLPIPTLLVRATEPMESLNPAEWRASWNGATRIIDVAGDHNSILQNQDTADAVAEWVLSLSNDPT